MYNLEFANTGKQKFKIKEIIVKAIAVLSEIKVGGRG